MKKRILSLVLTLAVFLALPSPALAAEAPYFRDEKDITHLEAAQAVVRLGIINGKEDGSCFDPKGTVTRGEAARCIALILRGGEDIVIAAGTPEAEPAFPDIKGHWAEAYINYCAEEGAAFAQENGNFDPNGPASEFELLRMVEVALGETPNQYVAAENWIVLTHALALLYDLFPGLDDFEGKAVTDHPLTRDEAAQILYNALNATPRVLSSSGFYEDTKRPDGTPSTLLWERFGFDSWDTVSLHPDKVKQEDPTPKAQRGIDPTAFTDAKDIAHWEAVAALSKLGIISGRDDGAFHPAGNVTRAEAAKMICVLMNGGSEANTGVRKEPSFTDIQGHWAEGYIEYCADMGIASGWDGRFDPEGQVSVLQFYKMALTALGYDPEAYALVGSRWAEQTLERARSSDGRKLTEGLENEGLDGTGADQSAIREVAAQILYNALLANPIMISPDGQNDDGDVIWKFSAKEDETFLRQRFGLKEMPSIPPQPTV